MHNSLKNYSVSTSDNAMLLNEVKRIEAITGVRMSSSTDGAQYMKDAFDKLFCYVLASGPAVSLHIMTKEAYEIVKKPDIRCLKTWPIAKTAGVKKSALEVVAVGKSLRLSQASSRDGIYPVVVDEDIQRAATIINTWYKKGSTMDKGFNVGVTWSMERMSPRVLVNLAAIAMHQELYESQFGNVNRAAWEEMRMIGLDTRITRQVGHQLSGAGRFINGSSTV